MKIICNGSCTSAINHPGSIEGMMTCLSGLRRLGHEVYWVEEVESKHCFDEQYNRVPFEAWEGRQHFESLARSFALWPNCSLLYNSGQATYGMSYPELVRLAKGSDLLLVFGGFPKAFEIWDTIPRRAYVDGNPGKTQVYSSEHGVDYGFRHYHHFFTLGLNIGTPACDLPTCGVTWHGILPPVLLDQWPARIDETCERFTTVSSWGGRHTFVWKGRYSGGKDSNWLQFAELPRKTRQPLEIALEIKEGYEKDLKVMQENGWLITDPKRLRTLDDLRDYYAHSRAEFSVAHGRYVEFRTGWFSDRSVRYLACGKPVLVQSTGIESHLPTGKGLLTFTNLEEAVAEIEAINADYLAHCRAARGLAEEFFDSDKVLSKMLRQMGF